MASTEIVAINVNMLVCKSFQCNIFVIHATLFKILYTSPSFLEEVKLQDLGIPHEVIVMLYSFDLLGLHWIHEKFLIIHWNPFSVPVYFHLKISTDECFMHIIWNHNHSQLIVTGISESLKGQWKIWIVHQNIMGE